MKLQKALDKAKHNRKRAEVLAVKGQPSIKPQHNEDESKWTPPVKNTPAVGAIHLDVVKKQRRIPEMPTSVPVQQTIHEPMDCYEVLKTNIIVRYPGHTIKTILFSGTTHGNGVSTTAINFATTLARNCRLKVLLIDANLRTSILHTVFRVEQEHGLSDIIANGDNPGSCVKKVEPENLSIVTAGSKLSGPMSLFESSRFSKFLKFLRAQFDYIILDGPPVPNFSEARVLCTKVDGVVLVIKAGNTREQVAVRAKKELEEAGGKVLGVVLNKRKYHIPKWIYKRL